MSSSLKLITVVSYSPPARLQGWGVLFTAVAGLIALPVVAQHKESWRRVSSVACTHAITIAVMAAVNCQQQSRNG